MALPRWIFHHCKALLSKPECPDPRQDLRLSIRFSNFQNKTSATGKKIRPASLEYQFFFKEITTGAFLEDQPDVTVLRIDAFVGAWRDHFGAPANIDEWVTGYFPAMNVSDADLKDDLKAVTRNQNTVAIVAVPLEGISEPQTVITSNGVPTEREIPFLKTVQLTGITKITDGWSGSPIVAEDGLVGLLFHRRTVMNTIPELK